METPLIGQAVVLALAVTLGVGFASSLTKQMTLQRGAIAGDPRCSLINRLTMAGLSMSILFGGVLAAKAVSNTIPTEAFILAVSFGALSTLVLYQRGEAGRARKRHAPLTVNGISRRCVACFSQPEALLGARLCSSDVLC